MNKSEPTGIELVQLMYPSLIALAAVLMTWLGREPLLKSARPFVPVSEQVRRPTAPPGLEAIMARPWEDPLTVYEDHPSPQGEKERLESARRKLPYIQRHFASRINQAPNEKGKTLVLFPLVPSGGDSDAHESRVRYRNSVTAALTRQGYYLTYPKRLSYFDLAVPIHVATPPKKSTPRTPAAIATNRGNTWSAKCLMTFLGRLLAGGSGDAGGGDGDHTTATPTETLIRMPVKLYQRDVVPEVNHAPQFVLVFWIDEDRLGRAPLDALAGIYNQIFAKVLQDPGRKDDLHLAILGPSSSDGLVAMDQELRRLKEGDALAAEPPKYPPFGPARVSLFSPRATAFYWADNDASHSDKRSPNSIINF